MNEVLFQVLGFLGSIMDLRSLTLKQQIIKKTKENIWRTLKYLENTKIFGNLSVGGRRSD